MSEQTKNLLGGNYNPDVLECLANLSNDEVFTPPKVVNQMLDMLPPETWSNPNLKFLDPACKTGVFLREIAKRLIVGLEEQIPDLQQRLDHIFHNQLYGIAITELTALASRRSLYCSKYANGRYSVSKFDNPDGNIRFVPISHTWENGKCKYCGASASQYQRADDLETHAYEFIHTNNPKEIFGMKFDIIIGNPPYQMNDGGGTGDSAKPIYNLFINNSLLLAPDYFAMIVPSRWMKGGKGLEKFRQEMMRNTNIKAIVDYEDASECFPGVHIDGGVCYFLIDGRYDGKCNFTHIGKDGYTDVSNRYLENNISPTIIRDSRQISIIQKAKDAKTFDYIVSAQKPYGFRADFYNHPENYPGIVKREKKDSEYAIAVYGVKGVKGGAKRTINYIKECDVAKNRKSIHTYKLFFSKAYMATATVPPEIIIGEPGEICTETFLQIGNFSTESEAKNALSYIKTKFFRALLFFNRHSLNISQESFVLIPLQDFSKPWTDEELYKKYNLSEEEIKFIEENIAPMEDK
ncbi:MAG: Eco57I restriction-modification methylase domain-containing protein [Candidatus Saccharibacteria bacterium]|nr:Eco57I restriction-modification methylase domain-containing protein [Candidatus Saccharibacteria bacterium]